MKLSEFKKLPIMGILRGIDKTSLAPLLETIIASGMKTIEITMNTDAACELISEAVAISSGKLTIGAGTVLSMDDMHNALNAGASFIVMPTFIAEIVDYCTAHNIPVFPGALTPQEVFQVSQNGASMVKVFPSSLFGPRYFKELKGPFDKISLMAVGGVRLDNVSEFFQSGAEAVAVGGSIFNLKLIRENTFETIEKNLKALVDAVKACIS